MTIFQSLFSQDFTKVIHPDSTTENRVFSVSQQYNLQHQAVTFFSPFYFLFFVLSNPRFKESQLFMRQFQRYLKPSCKTEKVSSNRNRLMYRLYMIQGISWSHIPDSTLTGLTGDTLYMCFIYMLGMTPRSHMKGIFTLPKDINTGNSQICG